MDGKSTSLLNGYRIEQEDFSDAFYEEVYPLFEKHWEEIASDKDKIPLSPDYDKYYLLQDHELLKIVTCREESTHELVGYTFSILSTHLHYKETMVAENDLIFVLPEHRHGWLGYRLIKETEKILKQAGCVVLQMRVKTTNDFGKVVERLGYQHSETLYRKYIGED